MESQEIPTTVLESKWCRASVAASKEWVRGRLLGSGSFGSVNTAVNTSTGALFAVKSVYLSPDCLRRDVNLKVLEHEIEMLTSLDCPEIVRCLGSSWTREETDGGCLRTCRNLHLELAPGGSVGALLKDAGRKGLPENLLRRASSHMPETG